MQLVAFITSISWAGKQRIMLPPAACVLALCVASPADAAGTPAGTLIDNVATASYDGPTGRVDVPSNVATVRVDELLDVVVDSTDPGDVAVGSGDTSKPLKFQLTNSGNGPEAFRLSADPARPGDDFDPALVQIVLDSNNNGAYDPGTDTVYVPGSNDPLLQPDTSTTIFVINNIPATASDGQRGAVQLTAASVTGTGPPGTAFAGLGEGGGDAVVGATGADSADSGVFIVSAASLALVKSATVLDPYGGDQVIPGSVVTYRIVATVTGSGSLSNLSVSDPIPIGTVYVPNSITLDAATQTDAADLDASTFSSNSVRATLGTVPGGTTRSITFKVRIP